MANTKRFMTADELLRMPDDHQRHELVRGELRTMPLCGAEHGCISVHLTMHLATHVRSMGLGEAVLGGTGFQLASNPDTVLAPDGAFIRAERIGTGRPFWQGPPDLATEVVSPDDSFDTVQGRVLDWLDAGTRMVLVVEPETCTVTVWRARGRARILGADDVIDGEDVIPGWRCPVHELFPR